MYRFVVKFAGQIGGQISSKAGSEIAGVVREAPRPQRMQKGIQFVW
jgi:hypothetical protein